MQVLSRKVLVGKEELYSLIGRYSKKKWTYVVFPGVILKK